MSAFSRALVLISALALIGCGGQGQTAPFQAPGTGLVGASAPPAAAEFGLPGGCPRLEHLDPRDRALADTLLAQALDNEALFTLAGIVKPMSTVTNLRMQLFEGEVPAGGVTSGVSVGDPELRRMAEVTRVADALDCGPLDFIVVPFRATPDTVRTMAVSVVHRGLLDALLEEKADFFGKWGFTPAADPGTVVSVIEFEERLDRYRGYGLLFGYPDYAVDFFVEAARHQDRTGEFVSRDFIQVPVHSGQRGRFVYAVPQGHQPVEADRRLRERAAEVLAAYRRIRPTWVNADGTLRAAELLRAWGWGRGVPMDSVVRR